MEKTRGGGKKLRTTVNIEYWVDHKKSNQKGRSRSVARQYFTEGGKSDNFRKGIEDRKEGEDCRWKIGW